MYRICTPVKTKSNQPTITVSVLYKSPSSPTEPAIPSPTQLLRYQRHMPSVFSKISEWGPLITSHVNCGYCSQPLPIQTLNRQGCANDGRSFASHHPHDQYGNSLHNLFHIWVNEKIHPPGSEPSPPPAPPRPRPYRRMFKCAVAMCMDRRVSSVCGRRMCFKHCQIAGGCGRHQALHPQGLLQLGIQAGTLSQESAPEATSSTYVEYDASMLQAGPMARTTSYIYSRTDVEEREQLTVAIKASQSTLPPTRALQDTAEDTPRNPLPSSSRMQHPLPSSSSSSLEYLYSQTDDEENRHLLMAISASTSSHLALSLHSSSSGASSSSGSSASSSGPRTSAAGTTLASLASGSSSGSSSSSSRAYSYAWDPALLASIRAANDRGCSESSASTDSEASPRPSSSWPFKSERIEIDLTLMDAEEDLAQ
ncbi:hypothetical protein C2E23DRAFT_824094 [Lenzites betulinus]|nr:hypothetical protein C2E23DRAFT_824094 [Lenzites betulinus]